MIPYLILALSPVLIGSFFQLRYNRSIHSNDNHKKAFLWLFGLVLFIMIAFRNPYVGSTDSINYYNNWEDLSHATLSETIDFIDATTMEGGYILTVWVLSKVFINPQWVFILSGLLFTVSICRFIAKNSADAILSAVMFVTLGLYSFMVQGLRQAIAMSILLFAIEFCKKRKFIPFLMLVLFATLYHKTAIVFVFLYFLYGIPLNALTYTCAIGCSVGLIALSVPIVNVANQLFESDYNQSIDSGGFIATAIYLIILIVATLFKPKDGDQLHYSFFWMITALGCTTYIMRYTGTLAAERISFYFLFGQVIILPEVIRTFKKRDRFLIKMLVIFLCVALFFYRNNGSDLDPYRFFWQ